MAIYTNNFEGGTSGVAMTVANSGMASGNAFSQVTPGFSYSSSYVAHERRSVAIVNPGANYRSFNWAVTDPNVFSRMYFYFDGTVPSGVIMTLNTSAGSPAHLGVGSGPAAPLHMQLFADGLNRGSTPFDIEADKWYRAEVMRTVDAIRWALYEGDSVTPVYESPESTGLALGTMNQVIFGKNNNNDDSGTLRYVDSVGVKTGADAIWRPWPYNPNIEDLVWTGSQWR